MKPPLNDRIQKVIRLAQMVSVVNSIVTMVATFFLATYLVESIGFFGALVGAIIFSWFFVRFLNMITTIAIQVIVYQGDIDTLNADVREMIKDQQKIDIEERLVKPPEPKKIKINILECSANPIGKYMDAFIYDWVIIDDGVNGARKFHFSGTTKCDQNQMIDGSRVVFKPGIIYQVNPQ